MLVITLVIALNTADLFETYAVTIVATMVLPYFLPRLQFNDLPISYWWRLYNYFNSRHLVVKLGKSKALWVLYTKDLLPQLHH